MASGTPMLYDSLRGQIEHPAQGIIVGKAGLVFGDLTELAVETLNDIGRVYDFPNLWRVFIERTQNFPVFLPALYARGVLAAPFFSELEQVFLRFLQGDSGVNFLQVSRHLLDILPADIPGGGTNLVDDAALYRPSDSFHHPICQQEGYQSGDD